MPDEAELLQRLAAGERLDEAEQRRLAAALRADPGLRRHLRATAVGEARLARAVRAAAPARRAPARPVASPLRWAILAAAAVVVLAVGAAVWWSLPGTAAPSDAPVAEQPAPAAPPEAVRPEGAFALASDRSGAMVLDRSRIELEAGSAGSVTRRADAVPVVNLASGGALLRVASPADSLQIEAGPASITAQGDVAVRYLDVPEGAEPAIQVEVAEGRARVVSGGVSHELRRGETKVVAKAGRLNATVAANEVGARRLVLEGRGGAGRLSWNVPWDAVPQRGPRQEPILAQGIDPGWVVQVELDAARREVTGIDIPEQSIAGTLGSLDGEGRSLVLLHGPRGRAETWPLAAEAAVDRALVGHPVRLMIDPATRQVVHVAAQQEPHRRPRAIEAPKPRP